MAIPMLWWEICRPALTWIDPVIAITSGTIQMKRYIGNLLQHPRNRFDSFHAGRRHSTPRNVAASTSLRPEDGYDWLRQIKLVQVDRPAGR